MVRSRMRLSNLQIVALGYFLVILTGTLLLMLPISTQEGQPPTSVLDALFTAVSASCVTGLVVVDTGTHWTVFGQLVILGLIQIGGLGFMTISLGFLLLMRKRIGLRHREVMVESINSMQIGGVVRLTRKILYGTLLFEGLGALFLAIRFIPQFGWKQGAYFSVFHSISAFCNAGFDLFGNYNSIVAYADDALVNFTLMGLITMGGLGFLVWEDLWQKKWSFRHLRLQTKIVLSTSFALTVGGGFLLLMLERNNLNVDMSNSERLLTAFFQSCTARTAGFNSVDPGAMTSGSKMLMMLLMFIGGSPGSTAGGIKTTTLMVILMYTLAGVRHARSANIFGRRLEEDALHKAIYVFFVNLIFVILGTIAICSVQNLELTDVLFEAFSAMGTVGISTGITRELEVFPRLVIIFLMYCGRVGSISFAVALMERKAVPPVTMPLEKITIG